MFATRKAIEVLVMSDQRASDEEKKRVMDAIASSGNSDFDEQIKVQKVVSFDVARDMLGYSSKAGVYRAVRDGVLKAYYGGKGGLRATGIILDSINQRTAV